MSQNVELKRAFKYLKPYIPRFLLAMFCMATYAVMDLYVLTVLNDFINTIFERSDTVDMLLKIALIIPLVYAVIGIADFGRSYLLNYIGENVIMDMRKELHSKLMSLSHSFYVLNSSAKMMSRVTNDLGAVKNAIVKVPATLTKELLIFIGMGIYVFYLNWKFALILVAALPVIVLPLYFFAKRIRKASRSGQQQMAEIYSSLQQMLNGFSVIRAYNSEEHEIKRFREDNKKFYNIALGISRVDARSAPIVEIIGACAIAAFLFIGGQDVINGVWSSGDFIVFFYAITKMYRPIKSFSNLNSQIQGGLASAERVFEVLDEKPKIYNSDKAKDLKPFSKDLVYKNINFGYNPDKTILKDFNLTIKRADSGYCRSGSGKTTIGNLL